MIVSIHQPQYIPWLPYFMKISESNVFILLDSVDFQKNGLQNRNRIKTAQGPNWLTVPIKQKIGQKIIDVEINNDVIWQKKHYASIVQNYGKAQFAMPYIKDLEEIYARKWDRLIDLNMHILELMLQWLDISTTIIRSSSMKSEGKGSELILNLCCEVGATRYVSGIGGKNYLDEKSFTDRGIEVVYRPPVLPIYYQQQHPKAGFFNNLSALDILLNCGSNWRSYVREQEI